MSRMAPPRSILYRPDPRVWYPVAEMRPFTGLSSASSYNRRSAGRPMPRMSRIAGRLGAWGEDIVRWQDDQADDQKPTHCSICGYVGRTPNGLAAHQRRKHGNTG